MPSLRERSKRPSYALLADPLEGLLSDEDRDSDASQAEGSQAGAKRRAKSESSASTDFGAASTSGPKSKGKGKAKGKVKGKGKGKASAFDDSGSEFEGPSSGEEEDDDDMEDDAVDEVEEEAKEDGQGMEGVDDEKEDDLVAMNSPPMRPPPLPRRIPTAFTNAPSHSNQAVYVQSDTNLIPLRYRELVVKHSEIIAAPFRGKPSATPKERDYRARTLDPVVLPHGPCTPFVTRLKKEVKGREMAEVIYDQKLGHDTNEVEEKLRRQRNASLIVKSVTLAAPWQVWQGEGWWPEMAPGHPANAYQDAADGTAEAQQKGIPKTAKGWTPRDAVRLGLDRVGRYKIQQMRLLSKEQAVPYMPITKDLNGNPHATFNIGLHDKQIKVDFKPLDSHPLGRFNPTKSGFIFSAGGPIWGMDWCPFPDAKADKHAHTQYLAVSTMPHLDTKASIGHKWPINSPASIQIWGAAPPILDASDKVIVEGRMTCELVLCVGGGPALDLKWMPLGAWDDDEGVDGIPKLGIIAACQLDGSVSFYAVPHPKDIRQQTGAPEGQTIYWQVDKPLLRHELPDSMCNCIDWINGGRLICGTSTGFLAVWDILAALRNPGLGPPLPSMYISVAQSLIKSISIGRDPPEDANGLSDYTRDPVYVVCASHDATVNIIDLRDREQQYELTRSRMPTMSVAWSNQLGCPAWADNDHTPQLHDPRGRFNSKSYGFAHHRGPVWSIAMSDYHTMALTGSTDGSVVLSNLEAGWFRRRGGGMIFQRLFEIDYDIYTGEYRIIDDYLPVELALEAAQQKNANKAKGTGHSLEGNQVAAKSADWSLNVAIHKVCWNNNNDLGRAGWAASGSASGIGRVDIIRGRFINGRTPAGLGP